jgi:hypothetical protein
VTFTGLRNDDFRPFVYKTTDYGQTWSSIVGNLPAKSVNVIREDPYNPNLLFVGMDFGLYVSIDGGTTWQEMKNGLPTQPVYDLKIHPRERDLIVATHGRGIFITDISALEEISDKTLAQDFYLFDVESKVKWTVRRANVSASTNFNGESEPNGVMINYFQKAPATGDVTVKIIQGSRVVAETKGPNAAGMNQILWNMQATPVTIPGQDPPQETGRGGRGGAGGGRGGAAGAEPVVAGAELAAAGVASRHPLPTRPSAAPSRPTSVSTSLWSQLAARPSRRRSR